MRSKIEWTGETWNPILGCTKISAGCRNCYAAHQAYRNWEMAKALPEEHRGRLAYYEDLTQKTKWGSKEWTGILKFVPEALEIPLKRKKPQTYFVNSMSDMFHPKCQDEWIDQIFEVIEKTPQHTYQILTKRPDRMIDYMKRKYLCAGIALGNVWLGSTIENQDCIDDRIPTLAKLNKRGWTTFYSCEPLLESVDLLIPDYPVSWVITGGESGLNSSPCHYEWLLYIVEQCQETNTPVFVKQLGANYHKGGVKITTKGKGGDINEFPLPIQVREFPLISC